MEEQSQEENYQGEEKFSAHLSCNRLNLSEKVGMPANGKFLLIEIDSEAARSVISEVQFKEMFPKASILPINIDFSVVTGQSVTVLGKFNTTKIVPCCHC